MLKEILQAIQQNGGKPYKVGGWVRDRLLGIPSKDIDIEVFGLDYDALSGILSRFGKVDLVGKKFGVLKVNVNGEDYDFNLPRRDSKNGIGHKDFDIVVDHTMTIEDAAARRDFTINSMSVDVDGNLIDPYMGRFDLEAKRLNPTSEAFLEDSLRILRGFQFSARFDMRPTLGCCMDAVEMKKEYYELSIERIWEEWKKWASKGIHYSTSLKYLKNVYWLSLYPEIDALYGLEQDKFWHPEGDVLIHTGFVLDHMAEVCVRENITGDDRLVLIFSALCHDMGKAVCSEKKFSEKYNREVITSIQHEKLGVPIARKFLESIGCPEKIIERVLPLVENHMVGHNLLSDKAIKKLSVRLGKATIQELCYLIESDVCGRPPLPKEFSDKFLHFIYRSVKLGLMNGKPEHMVSGQDIVEFGYAPGPIVGKIYRKLYELQCSEAFENKAQGLKMIHTFVKQL